MTAPKSFYLDMKHVHQYSCATFQPNLIFSSQQMTKESPASVAEEKKSTKKKSARL